VIVSDEDLRLREPFTVEALPVDARLDCFECEFATLDIDFARLAVELLADSVGTGGSCGTDCIGDFLIITFLDELEVTELVERSDVDDGDFLMTLGLSLALSDVEEAARLAFTAGVALDTLEGGRDLAAFGEVVLTVLLLVVETVDAAD